MVDSVTSASTGAVAAATSAITSAQTSDLSSALGSTTQLGEQDFLKLLIAQLQNQDPLSPQDNTQFVSQLAQFSSLQAAMGTNTRLDTMTSQNASAANSAAVDLIGKTATVKGSLVSDDGSGAAMPLGFTLAAASASTDISILDSSGAVVRTISVGAHDAGLVKTAWDGRDNSGNILPAGSYTVSVQAKTQAGGTVSVAQESTGTVKAVSFDKGYPVLTLDNGMEVPATDLIEIDSSSP